MDDHPFRDAVVRALAVALAATAVVAAAAGQAGRLDPADTASGRPRPGHAASSSTARIQRLVDHHGCWTDAHGSPQHRRGRLPGHVVAMTATGRPRWSAALVGPALPTTCSRAGTPG